RYVSDDPEKLKDRLVNQTQVLASAVTHRLTLKAALGAHAQLTKELLNGLRESELTTMLGVEVIGLSILAITPSPETAKAYEVEAIVKPLRQTDWRIVSAVTAGRMDAKLNIAMEFRELAEKADKIGNLTISPELLSSLLVDRPSK